VESGRRAADYLRRSLVAETALPDRHDYLEADSTRIKGMLIAKTVKPGSSAEAAGFRAGDRIVNINGREISGFNDLEIGWLQPEDETKKVFEISRDGSAITITSEGKLDGVAWSFSGRRNETGTRGE
jgi:S1-C subfamily serine protease